MRRLILFFSSNAGLGYVPVAPGTFGTLAGIPAFWLLAPLPTELYALTCCALFAFACDKGEKSEGAAAKDQPATAESAAEADEEPAEEGTGTSEDEGEDEEDEEDESADEEP